MKISSVVSAGLSSIRLILSLLALWLTLGWNVRKARKAFEKQLIRQGMSKKDAKRLSAKYSELKDDLMSTLKGSVFQMSSKRNVRIDLRTAER
jgi:DNA polymerase III delta prime subunit